MASAHSLWFRRLGIAAIVAVALGYLPYQLYSSSGLQRLFRLRAERDALHAANLKLYEANQRLRSELDALSDEPNGLGLSRAAIERMARDELNLVRPGEVVIQLEERSR
jgi:cell division protein FtsB